MSDPSPLVLYLLFAVGIGAWMGGSLLLYPSRVSRVLLTFTDLAIGAWMHGAVHFHAAAWIVVALLLGLASLVASELSDDDDPPPTRRETVIHVLWTAGAYVAWFRLSGWALVPTAVCMYVWFGAGTPDATPPLPPPPRRVVPARYHACVGARRVW